MVARLVFWLLIVVLLLFLFVFSRKRFNQVILVGALSTAAEVVIRLTHLGGFDKSELLSEGYFLIGIGVLYGLVWLGGKYRGWGDDGTTIKKKSGSRGAK